MRNKLFGTDITQDQYNSFKEKALNNGIVRKIIQTSNLGLISDSLISIGGVEFEMTPNAFKSLVRILGLSNAVMNKISNTLGEKVASQLLQMMQVAISQVEGKDKICILATRDAKIVDFTKDAKMILSNNAYFKLFEDTMNNHNGMHIKNMSITENGNIEISVLNNNWEFNVGGLNEEYFKSGLVFINTPSQTIINPFNERLTCTNGMVVANEGLSLILKNNDVNSLNGFFDTVRNLKGVLNFETEFKHRVLLMMETVASYAEVLDVRKLVEYHVANMTEPDIRDIVEEFIPTTYIKQAYLEHKIDLNIIDTKKYKKIKTMLTVWELVNKLTDLSSHPQRYGLMLENNSSSIFELQRKAGELSFKKEYDFEMPVKQIF